MFIYRLYPIDVSYTLYNTKTVLNPPIFRKKIKKNLSCVICEFRVRVKVIVGVTIFNDVTIC